MKNKGVTLIEILFVIAIIAILAGLLVPLFTRKIPDNCIATPLGDFQWSVVNIDGCQYIIFKGAEGYRYLTHKGNCTNHAAIKAEQ